MIINMINLSSKPNFRVWADLGDTKFHSTQTLEDNTSLKEEILAKKYNI
jgi:hypothetical protein